MFIFYSKFVHSHILRVLHVNLNLNLNFKNFTSFTVNFFKTLKFRKTFKFILFVEVSEPRGLQA